MTSCSLWGIWVKYLPWTDPPSPPLVNILRVLVIVAGWYFGLMALFTHFLARRAIQEAEKSQTRLDGDFTALLAALLAVFVLVLWNQAFSVIRFPALFLVFAWEGNVELVDAGAKTVDATLTVLALLGTIGYAFASGPGAMRRLIVVLTIVVFVVGLAAPFLTQSRERSRRQTGMHRAAQLGRAFMQHTDIHRKAPERASQSSESE